MRWRHNFILALGVCCAATLAGQRSVLLPVGLAVDGITVGFTYTPVSTASALGEGRILEDGSVRLPGPGAVGIRINGLNVVGVKPKDSVAVTLFFPPLLPSGKEEVVSLSTHSPTATLVLNVAKSAQLSALVPVKVSLLNLEADASFTFVQSVIIGEDSGLAPPISVEAAGVNAELSSKESRNRGEQVGQMAPAEESKTLANAILAQQPVVAPAQKDPPSDIAAQSSKLTNQDGEETEAGAAAEPVYELPASARPMTYSDSQSGSVHELVFERVTHLQVTDTATQMGIVILENTPLPNNRHRLVVDSRRAGFHRIEVFDSTKAPEHQRLGLYIDNRLTGSLAESRQQLVFNELKGGVPPYNLVFYRGQEYVATLEDVASEGLTVPKSDLLAIYPEGGVFSVRMLDGNNEGEFVFDGQTVSIQPDVAEVDERLWYGLLGLAGLIIAYVGYQSYAKRRKQSNFKKVRDEMYDPLPAAAAGQPELTAVTTEKATTTQPVADETTKSAAFIAELDQYPKPPPEHAEPTPSESLDEETAEETPTRKIAMRISRRDEGELRRSKPFAPDEAASDFLRLPLDVHWEQSMITELYLGSQAIEDLDEFLQRENVDKIMATDTDREKIGWERNESVPEIGGMLMGQFQRVEEVLAYRVSVEKFVPLQARYQSVTKIEIDPLSIARDLGDAQDENPDLIVVGWFHTHPGHGLFLSRPDLKIQYSHFHRPFHLAMEIDSLSERLDTGFFTYLPSGHMNNSATLRPDTPWFSWKKIRAQYH